MVQERMAVGKFKATGAAINVNCGFIPRYVEIQNFTDTHYAKGTWFQGMAAASGFIEKTGATYIARTYIASAGITEYTGADSDGAGLGFTIGTNADLNTDGDVLYYVAIR